MSNIYSDILILGAGPAGLSAAISAKMQKPNFNIRIIEKAAPYHKIGCVIRNKTFSMISDLGLDNVEFLEINKFDESNIFSISRMDFETSLRDKAISLGVNIIEDTILTLEFSEDIIEKVNTASGRSYTSNFYVDATGQVAIIARLFGHRKSSGTLFKAAYTHFYSEKEMDVIKNMPTNNGFLWIVPIPSDRKNWFKYQLTQVLKEGSEVVTHENLVASLPSLTKWGFPEKVEFVDPCNIFKTYVRQYPPFIFDNIKSKGINWISLGDADTTYFDKIFSGIDKAISDGIRFGESLAD